MSFNRDNHYEIVDQMKSLGWRPEGLGSLCLYIIIYLPFFKFKLKMDTNEWPVLAELWLFTWNNFKVKRVSYTCRNLHIVFILHTAMLWKVVWEVCVCVCSNPAFVFLSLSSAVVCWLQGRLKGEPLTFTPSYIILSGVSLRGCEIKRSSPGS